MSRFTPSDDNLRITVEDPQADLLAVAVARVLARGGERRIYFSSFVSLQYPELKRFKGAAITILSSGQTPPNLIQSARIIHSKGQLVVASPKYLREDQWKKVAADIEADIAKGVNAG